MKRILSMICVFSMLISLSNVVSFAEDTNVVVITSGRDFNEKVKSANFGKTFRIEGTETLADGSTGIVLLGDQDSLTGFYGKIEGVDGKNNIQTTKTLIGSVSKDGIVRFENLILKGPENDGTGLISSTSNTGALVSQATAASDYPVEFNNITNYISVSVTANNYAAAGIMGYTRYRAVSFANCVNFGNITSSGSSDNSAGGILGNARDTSAVSVVFDRCYNHGKITASGFAGGLLGRNYNSTITISATNCGNFGDISSTAAYSSTYRAAGGIGGNYVNASNSFNAGAINSTMLAGGILGVAANTSLLVKNCFNAGNVTTTDSTGTYWASGIVGSYSSTNVTVENSYNVGEISGAGTRQIADTKTAAQDSLCVGNYYVSDSDLNQAVGTSITLEALAESLPEGFSSDVWTYTEGSRYKYSLPQIKGNEFINTINNDWYIGTVLPEATFINTKSFSPEDINDEEYNEFGSYAVVITKFDLIAVEYSEITEFGMYLLDENGNYLATALADNGKRSNGIFGILFYGENFEEGKIYKAEPYIKVGEDEYKGTPAEFKISESY